MLRLLGKDKNSLGLLVNCKDVCVETDLKTGLKSLSFSFPITDNLASLIEGECYIQTQDYEFVVKEVNKEGSDWFSIFAQSNVEALSGKPHKNFAGLEQTAANIIRLAIVDTGWTVQEINTIIKKRTVRREIGSTLDIINDVAKVFMIEIEFDTLNRKIKIYDKRGADKGAYFINQLNLIKLQEQSSTYDFITRLIPIGKDDLRIAEINGGKDYIDNCQYSDKIIAQYWEDSRYTVVEALKEDATAKLEELSKPKTSYSANVLTFNTPISIGDTITLIDNIKGIRETQRVVKLKEYPLTPEKDTIEIANRTLSFTEIQQNLQNAANIIGDVTTDSGAIDASKIEGVIEADTEIKDGSITTDKLAANAVTTEKLFAGAVTADKIQTGTITAAQCEVGMIKANSAIIEEAAIGTAQIAKAAIENAQIADAAIDNAKIDVAAISSAQIQDLAVGNAQIADASITNAKIGSLAVDTANIKDAAITNAKIDNLSADKITAGQIDADRITANVIEAINASIGKIDAEHIDVDSITVENIDAGKITTGTLDADRIGANSIDASKITITDMTNLAVYFQDSNNANKEYPLIKRDTEITKRLTMDGDKTKLEFQLDLYAKADEGCKLPLYVMGGIDTTQGWAFPKMEISKPNGDWQHFLIDFKCDIPDGSEIKNYAIQFFIDKPKANTDNWKVKYVSLRRKSAGSLIVDGSITADNIQAGAITADKITTEAIETKHIKAEAITAGQIAANAITTDKLNANSVTAEKIKAGAISADKINADTINSIQIGASEIVAGKIEAGEIKVGNANIVDGTISGAKISKASITNAQIDNAFIADAYIKNLDAGKITTGKLDATKVSIGSTSGNLTLADNTLTIKDASNKTRVQVGKDAKENYGIIVTNADGQAIFDSDKGVLISEGLNDGVVSEDKIRDEAIGSSKLNTDELFVGDNAFINKLKAVEISANNITTGTISNERIDMKGLISFEHFDDTIQPVFDVEGDKTYINGGMIATNTIKADKIDLLSGLTVQGPNGDTTFAIKSNGTVEVNGLLQSGNFDENKSMGYKISPDGTAILNQAKVTGEFVMPNAGITNYGATVGNENLFKGYPREVTLNDYQNTGGFTQFSNCLTFNPANYVGKNFTISFWAKSPNGATKLQCYNQNGNPRYFFFSKTLDSSLGSEWEFYHFTFTNTDREEYTAIYNRIEIYAPDKKGVMVKDIKIELGDEVTPWCPAKEEQFDYTRIWAGEGYALRDKAPFRVTQKGDLWATNATLNGRLLGDYDNGKVHIHNNEIVINETATRMTPLGEIENAEPLHYNSNAHIVLSAGQSILNTDVVFGNNSDKRIEYSNANRKLNFNSTTLAYSKESTNLIIDGSSWQGVKLGNNSGTILTAGYSNSDNWLGTTILCHKGTRGRGYKDINIRRENIDEDIEVQIEGNVTVRNSVKSTKQNIEMRSIANEGWGFFAT